MADYKKQLLDKIAARTARVGVIGLGYVGLPLVVEFAHNGFNAMGFEVDARKSDAVNRGESYIPDVPTSQVAELVATGKLSATTDFSLLKEQDIIIICVPTPLRKTKDPDVSYILAASEKIKASLRSGQLVILESTTYPGTTDEVLKPIFDETGLKLDEDYFLAFSPERVDPGNERFNTKNITKVVGGVSQTSADVAGATYAAIVDKVHAVSSARVAEACKLLENTFRAVNIGLVNELALLCDTLGIDTWEVIGAAATKPFGFMAFYPGPGIGGHCLTGAETAVIRKAGGTQERVERLSDLFAEQYADDTNATFEFENGHVVQNPRLEALSINPEKHRPEWKPVSYLFRRAYQGKLVTITTSDNRRLTVTNEHPMLVSDADGQMCQMFAKDVAVGDRLPIHFRAAGDLAHFGDSLADPEIDLLPLLPPEMKERIRLRIIGGSWREYRATLKKRLKADVVQELMHQDYLPLSDYLAMEEADEIFIPHESLMLCTGRGPSFATFPAVTRITPAVARLIGYYLAEGCITQENSRDRVRLSFNRAEHEFISDVRAILEKELGVQSSVSDSRIDQVTHIRAASSVLGWLLADVLNCGRGSLTMRIPDVLLGASTVHQCELLRGLLRGDGDVYVDTGAQSYRKNGRSYISQNASAEIGYFSSSPQLFQQVIYLLQNLGFTPTFKRTKPHLQLKGFSQINQMRDWLGTKGAKLEDYFAAHQRVNASRTFKQFGNLMTVPVKSVEIHDTEQPVEVYSLEVEDNHTFTTSYGLYVHNCIPLDPHYLSWKARMHGFEARFISLAEEVNSRMPDHVVELVTRGLNEHRKAVNGSKVLILGVAYKRDIDDMRESPALGIIEKLQDLGAEVQFHDPYVAEVHLEGHDQIVKGTALTSELVADADCVVIVTDHRNANIDYGWVCERARLVVDTRNATRALTDERFNGKIIRL